jgi:WD40 repeat protein
LHTITSKGENISIWRVNSNASISKDVFNIGHHVTEPSKYFSDLKLPLCASFSPDDTKLLVGYDEGSLLFWDFAAHKSKMLIGEWADTEPPNASRL